MTKRTKTPSYSIVRLSATANNDNWFQQNATDADAKSLPKWAETLSKTVKLSVPVSMLGRGGAGTTADAESVASGDDSDSDDDDFDLPEDAGEQINPYRVRIWGLTTSPGGGVSAVLVSQHSTQQPEKTVKTRVMFGGRPFSLPAAQGDEMDVDGDETEPKKSATSLVWDGLSTEAKMWDWMYGGGPAVPGTIGFQGETAAGDASLKERLLEVRSKQTCVFCQTALQHGDKESVCEGGHVFGKFFLLDCLLALDTNFEEQLLVLQRGLPSLLLVSQGRVQSVGCGALLRRRLLRLPRNTSARRLLLKCLRRFAVVVEGSLWCDRRCRDEPIQKGPGGHNGGWLNGVYLNCHRHLTSL